MKAARLHNYHEALKVESIDEPKITEPFAVFWFQVRCGGAHGFFEASRSLACGRCQCNTQHRSRLITQEG